MPTAAEEKRVIRTEPKFRGPLVVVPREEWGALPPRDLDGKPMTYPMKAVVFTYNTGVKTCYHKHQCVERMRQLQQMHMDKGHSDIDFNFLIGGDGVAYEGRGWSVASPKKLQWKLEKWHGMKLDIAWIGNNIGIEYMPQHIFRTAYQLIKKGVEEGMIMKKHHLYQTRHKPPEKTYYYHPLNEDPQYL